jgi:uroporphyrinogen decarboxylase
MPGMSPRRRVLLALNHREPDLVPLDIGGGGSTTILAEGYGKLKQYLGVRTETRMMSELFRSVLLDECVMQRLGSDFRPLLLKSPRKRRRAGAAAGTVMDAWGIPWKKCEYAPGHFYYEVSSNPLRNAEIEDLERYPWPDTSDPGFTDGLAEEARALYENTNYALVGDAAFKSFWELGYMLRGYERLLTDLVVDPGFVDALMGKLLEINMAVTGRFLDAVGRYIQVFRTADDLATQQGLVMSRDMYRRHIKPVYRKYVELVRSKTDAKIFYHSCGNLNALLDDLIDAGVDIVNPVQVSAMGDTAVLKAEYGDRLVFWGGVDTQRVLPMGTEEEVRAEVKKRIRDLGPGGGFVLAAVHNVQPDVHPRNIIAMAEARDRYGVYPLRT